MEDKEETTTNQNTNRRKFSTIGELTHIYTNKHIHTLVDMDMVEHRSRDASSVKWVRKCNIGTNERIKKKNFWSHTTEEDTAEWI